MPAARRLTHLVVATAVVTAATALGASAAGAHVEAEASTVSPDGAAVIDFSFHHGCDGQATTGLRIQIPEGVTDVVPQAVEGWTVNSTPTEFGWSGGSVPDGDEATFTATMAVAGEAGTVIWFPTVQQCPTAEEAWIEIQEPGAVEPEMVAPSITLTSTIQGTTAVPATAVTTSPAPSTTVTTIPSGLATSTTVPAGVMPQTTESNTGGLIVLIVTMVLIVGGALVLYLRNRRPRTSLAAAPDAGSDQVDPDAPTDSARRSPH